MQRQYDICIYTYYVINFLRHPLTRTASAPFCACQTSSILALEVLSCTKVFFTDPQLNWGFLSCLFGANEVKASVIQALAFISAL